MALLLLPSSASAESNPAPQLPAFSQQDFHTLQLHMYDNVQHPALVDQHDAQPWAPSAPLSTFASQRDRCASRRPPFKLAQVQHLSDPTQSRTRPHPWLNLGQRLTSMHSLRP
ncbi:hypothetical protein DFP72DRAFT_1075676 [Ephemerocybe angulata]|uniref:Uncharacterized protein n=1 Tax=Ephemerocybe angulata TaxID=980116 RepID=A0A8H6LWY2_9AGAR|nr:hypothetical protein DFP72DRAFT_1075676 [Tulosesus angulatus]